ncbi:MAG: hypothetical protein KAS66_02780 [Candidatus Omnitrophica bacterium]|nr:hypothetical protein [Candidatus Omnitrophota bacterium]
MGPLNLNTENTRYFRDGIGEIIYLTGGHTWGIFQDWQKVGRDYINVDGFIALLNDNNHNFTRGWVCKSTRIPWPADNPISVDVMMYQRTGPETAWDGGLKFDLYEFNEQYFTALRNSVIKFRDNGIYVSMMMFYDTARNGGLEWSSHIFNAANNINDMDGDFNSDGKGPDIYNLDMLTNPSYPERREILTIHENFVKKVIDTIGDLENVIWEVGNEINYPDSIPFQHYFIDFIRAYDTEHRPVGLSADWNDTNNSVFDSSADWAAPNVYGGTNYAYNPPANTGGVIFLDTDHMGSLNVQNPSPNGDKEKDYRQWAWMSLTRGYYPLLMDDPMTPWDVAHIHALPAARRYLGDTRSYADRVDLSQTVPHGELSATGYCLASPGNEYIVYQKSSGSFNVNVIGGDYLIEWFNPTNSILEYSSTITLSTGQHLFTPPNNDDMVLFLSRISDIIHTKYTTHRGINRIKPRFGSIGNRFSNGSRFK